MDSSPHRILEWLAREKQWVWFESGTVWHAPFMPEEWALWGTNAVGMREARGTHRLLPFRVAFP